MQEDTLVSNLVQIGRETAEFLEGEKSKSSQKVLTCNVTEFCPKLHLAQTAMTS